jgi:hypothetical protein
MKLILSLGVTFLVTMTMVHLAYLLINPPIAYKTLEFAAFNVSWLTMVIVNIGLVLGEGIFHDRSSL